MDFILDLLCIFAIHTCCDELQYHYIIILITFLSPHLIPFYHISSLLGEDEDLDFSGSSDADSGTSSGSVLYDEGFEDGPVRRGFGEEEGDEEEEGEKSLLFCWWWEMFHSFPCDARYATVL